MKRTEWLLLAIIAMAMVIIAALAPYAIAAKADMLSYTVRIKDGKMMGSGVVIYSNGDTYIATANHVVAKSYEKLEAPDKKGNVTIYRDVDIQFFRYEVGRMKEIIIRKARVVAFDKDIDIAILKLNRRASPIEDGKIATAPIGELPELFDEVYSVGAGLGQFPFPTKGIVASLDGVSIEPGKNDPLFIMHSADVIWGFSGGGLYHLNTLSDTYELVGINVQVAVEMGMIGATVLTFMSYAVSMDDVKKVMRKAHVPKYELNNQKWLFVYE